MMDWLMDGLAHGWLFSAVLLAYLHAYRKNSGKFPAFYFFFQKSYNPSEDPLFSARRTVRSVRTGSTWRCPSPTTTQTVLGRCPIYRGPPMISLVPTIAGVHRLIVRTQTWPGRGRLARRRTWTRHSCCGRAFAVVFSSLL